MSEEHFEPVTIETSQPGRHFNVTNIHQIAIRLSGHWPATQKGDAYRKAVNVCMSHMGGRKNVAAVRTAFIDAAKEAEIFVRDGRGCE